MSDLTREDLDRWRDWGRRLLPAYMAREHDRIIALVEELALWVHLDSHGSRTCTCEGYPEHHDDDCIVTKARALLPEDDIKKGPPAETK